MRRAAERLARGVLWTLAAALTGLEALLGLAWLRGTLYVMEFGAAENPYAAESTEIAGLCALMLLPLALAAAVWIVYRAVIHCKGGNPIDR